MIAVIMPRVRMRAAVVRVIVGSFVIVGRDACRAVLALQQRVKAVAEEARSSIRRQCQQHERATESSVGVATEHRGARSGNGPLAIQQSIVRTAPTTVKVDATEE